MTSLSDYKRNCEFVLDNILDEQARIIEINENKIIQLNTGQFVEGMGSDGKDLFNTDERYTGIYKNVPGQTKSGLYNFFETGSFLSNLQLELTPDLSQINIFSTGTGTGKKSLFFAGYTNLFGLDKTNEDILNWDIVYPDMMGFINRYL